VATLALLGLAAGPAAAVRPDTLSFPVSDTYVIDCGTFSLEGAFEGTWDITFFVDESGEATRALVRVHARGTVVNTSTGESWSDPSDYAVHVVFADDTATYTGRVFQWITTGVGVFVLDVGRVTFGPNNAVVFAAGPHQTLGGDAAVCAAIA
jgi:hypothetical protein